MKPMKKLIDPTEEKAEIVQVQLKGEPARRFRKYKMDQFIRINAIAGEKLIMEGIERHEKAVKKGAQV